MKRLQKKERKRLIAPLMGFLALTWFLIRVIPKPSRATYPCQQAAFPVAAGFITWLIGISSSWIIFRKLKKLRNLPVYLKTILMFGPIMVSLILILTNTQDPIFGKTTETFVPTDGPNNPMGTGRGIHPGRVVWVYEPEATSWDGSGRWWHAEHTDFQMVEKMLDTSIMKLTGEENIESAWEATFRYFHQRRGEDRGYNPGEKIAVKLNLNNSNGHGDYDNRSNSSPQAVMALARNLVESAGVPDTCITFYDISRPISAPIYDPVHSAYPGIRFVDNLGGNGRNKFEVDYSAELNWSQERTIELGGGYPTYLPYCVSEADYIINLGDLKGHNLAGITICAKNHFGTYYSYSEESPTHSPPKAAGVHPYIAVHDFHQSTHWNFDMREMGTYNALVDIMGHKDLGEKTLLFLVDGLYAAPNQYDKLTTKDKWDSSPFSGDWTSSIFASFDGVAIESVALDFLRSEPGLQQVYGNVDNYLHEAALANNPPSGKIYDPENDGIVLESLGVHEHWNNPDEKKYSRNLGENEGIELLITTITGAPIPPPDGVVAYPDYQNQNILLLWSEEIPGARDLIVERADNVPVDFYEIARFSSSKTFYLDYEIETGTQYFYRMKSIGMFGEGLPGDTVTALVLGNEKFNETNYRVYPNPASYFITVDPGLNGKTIESIAVYNLSGKLVHTLNVPSQSGEIRMDISFLENGYYFLKIRSGTSIFSKKIAVSK